MAVDAERLDGLWQRFPREYRCAWLMAAYARWFAFAERWPQRPSGTVVEFDGALVDDLDSFFCAIGEAVNGPAGYFGQTLDGFADCAVGGFGITTPWVLQWEHSSVSRTALGYEATLSFESSIWESQDYVDDDARADAKKRIENLTARTGPTLFDTIVSILRDRNISVELL